jgi:hypothetical protein
VGTSRGTFSIVHPVSDSDGSCRYFAGEIIGNVLDLEPRRWMRPRKIDYRHSKDRIQRLKKKYEKYDWTGMIGKET